MAIKKVFFDKDERKWVRSREHLAERDIAGQEAVSSELLVQRYHSYKIQNDRALRLMIALTSKLLL